MERIGIIGAGRAGSALGAALASAGYPVTGVSARSRVSLDRAAELLPDVPVLPPDEVTARADVVLLGVPDDRIGTVAATLPLAPDQYVVHLSGAHGTAVLGDVAAVPVALHPSMTFPGGAVDLRRVVFTATAPPAAEDLVERLVKGLGASVQWIGEQHRALYHAGIVHGANHLITLVAQALDLLRETGIADPAGTLRPLLTASLDNTLRSGHDALTGPIARGDVDTVAAHLAVLRGRTASTYAELARATVERVTDDGRIDAATATRYAELLDRQQAPERDRTREAPR
ncbi:NADP oxidoreductase coenzyme F420-dependent [Kribbella flavida DSM 17836]|uniref:NADP oxidoreductase coenzyme F420-dependent n=1 Tax=Kribbella flavida (strain DSM 17836 / JCM 10339 / NBRC 14399) TaxID=479435 RepID=D2PY77_KRIFD|nr:Rossmann-like and DUF2520 domain-containing protein [Kribbella flavida]ADB35445.1 NADP oxidoreductase coenzyme F420-dependent [Kribbella flavida DSM 17836]